MKYYKFKLLTLFFDKKNNLEYYPEGIVSVFDYEVVLSDNKVSIMWRCKKTGVAYERMVSINKLILKECSKEEFKEIFDKINYNVNNEYISLFEKQKEETSVKFRIVK